MHNNFFTLFYFFRVMTPKTDQNKEGKYLQHAQTFDYTAWNVHQSVAGQMKIQPLTLAFIPKANLEVPIILIYISLDCGKKPEPCWHGENKVHTKIHQPACDFRSFCYEATVLTTVLFFEVTDFSLWFSHFQFFNLSFITNSNTLQLI